MACMREAIGLNPSVRLTPAQSSGIDHIASYPFGFLQQRLVEKHSVAEEDARQLILEFRRFMVIARLRGAPLAVPNGAVDQVWHELLLFTKRYRDFCAEAVGEFVDHVPHTSETPVPEAAIQRFVDSYEQLFGKLSADWFRDAPSPLRWSGWVK